LKVINFPIDCSLFLKSYDPPNNWLNKFAVGSKSLPLLLVAIFLGFLNSNGTNWLEIEIFRGILGELAYGGNHRIIYPAA